VLFDARDLSEVRRFSVADGASVTGVAFSTDGARLALATSTVLEVRTIADGSLVRRMPGERIVGVCTGFLPDGRVVDLRINAVVVANPDDGTSTVRFNVPATGSCQMTETGLMAMRLGDYIQPYDLVLDAPLWFSRGVVDGRISTQRGGPVWPPREFVAVTQVDAAFSLVQTSAYRRDTTTSRESKGTTMARQLAQDAAESACLAISDLAGLRGLAAGEPWTRLLAEVRALRLETEFLENARTVVANSFLSFVEAEKKKA
jgi:hypothetical protein